LIWHIWIVQIVSRVDYSNRINVLGLLHKLDVEPTFLALLVTAWKIIEHFVGELVDLVDNLEENLDFTN
jgi:hypothetical protein